MNRFLFCFLGAILPCKGTETLSETLTETNLVSVYYFFYHLISIRQIILSELGER